MLELSQLVVDAIDWGVIGVAGCLIVVSVAGAYLALRYSSSSRRPVAREFNYLWRARTFTEILAVGYALSHLLRLQLLWGPASIFQDGGYHPSTFCRVYIAATYGIFEPGFLLLALFACLYSVQGRDSAKNPNFNIVLFSAGFSLPSCAVQLVAALFTRIFDIQYTSSRILTMLFTTYNSNLHQHCDPDTLPSNCVFCVFPLLSTFASAAFAAIYLAAMWVVTQRIAATVINKALARRVRSLQLLTTFWIIVSLACRGCTVLFEPFEIGFEALRVGHMVSVTALVLTLEYFLVLKPVWDTRLADQTLRQLEKQSTGLAMPLFPPTELQPLESSTSTTRPEGDEDRV